MSTDMTNMSDEEFEAQYAEQMAALAKAEEEQGQEVPQQEEEPGTEEVTAEQDEQVDEAEQPDPDNSEDNDPAADADSDQHEQVDDETDDETDSDDSTDDATAIAEPEEQPEEEVKPEVTEPAPEQYVVKANGQEVAFDTIDEVLLMASKGMDYTKKMQRFAKHKTQISALEESGISDDELNLMIDVLKGDDKKAAISNLLKTVNIQADDLVLSEDESLDYKPKTYGRSAAELEIDEVVNNLSSDVTFKTTEHILSNTLDAGSRKFFAENPNQIYVLHDDVKAGRYEAIAREANKLSHLDTGTPRPFIDYYIEAGNKMLQRLQQDEALKLQKEQQEAQAKADAEKQKVEQAKADKAKQEKLKAEEAKRKAAGLTKASSPANTAPKDYLEEDMSDEEFLKLYESKVNNK